MFTDKLSSFKKRLIKTKLNNISKGKVSSDYLMSFHNLKKVKKRNQFSLSFVRDNERTKRKMSVGQRANNRQFKNFLTLEESYELLDAINNKDYNEIKNELGDLVAHCFLF